jgi:tripartite-type tricarboxylate transporter receptor subunit TctC
MRAVLLLVITLAAALNVAEAQNFPSRPVHIVTGVTAGSAVDIIARTLGEQLQKQMGQPFVIENRSGGAGTIAQAAVAGAEPDGHTILAYTSVHTVTPWIRKNLSYDVERSFAGLTPIVNTPLVLVVSSEKYKSVAELVAAAKASPNSLNYASVGRGSATHLTAERFRLSAGFEAQNIPFRGNPEALTDILAGRVDFYFSPILGALPLLREGKLRALAVSSASRSSMLPDVPTTLESGYPASDFNFWTGLFVPAKTPRPVVAQLHQEIMKALQVPSVQTRFSALGGDPFTMSPEEFDAYIRKEIQINGQLVKAAGIEPE